MSRRAPEVGCLSVRRSETTAVEGPSAAAGRGEIEKNEAEQDGGVTAVQDRIDAGWRVEQKYPGVASLIRQSASLFL